MLGLLPFSLAGFFLESLAFFLFLALPNGLLLSLVSNPLPFLLGRFPLETLPLKLCLELLSLTFFLFEACSLELCLVGESLSLGFSLLLLSVTLLFFQSSKLSLLSIIFFLFESNSFLLCGFPFEALPF